jgi:hypothetical protein
MPRFGYGAELAAGVLYNHVAHTEFLPSVCDDTVFVPGDLDYFSIGVDSEVTTPGQAFVLSSVATQNKFAPLERRGRLPNVAPEEEEVRPAKPKPRNPSYPIREVRNALIDAGVPVSDGIYLGGGTRQFTFEVGEQIYILRMTFRTPLEYAREHAEAIDIYHRLRIRSRG